MLYQKAIVLLGLAFSLGWVEMGAISSPKVAVAQTVVVGATEANQLLQEGIKQFNSHNSKAALQSWQKALAIYRAIQDKQGEAGTLMNMGFLYQSQSEFEKAITYYEQALPIFRQIKDLKGEANTLLNMGFTYQSRPEYINNQSRNVQSQTEQINNQSRMIQSIAACENKVGCNPADFLPANYKILYEKAITYYERALPIFRQIKDLKGEGDTLANMSATYIFLMQYEKGMSYQEQACRIFEQIKDSPDKCRK